MNCAHLLMAYMFAISLDRDQAWQNVRPDLEPNWLIYFDGTCIIEKNFMPPKEFWEA